MKVPIWVHEMAAFFWEAAGAREPFPRALRQPIQRSLFELTIKEMPALTIRTIERYLGGLGPGWVCTGPNRPLRACLAARDGAGFILLDAADPPAERVFSLAHELAHFLCHYWQPRKRAASQLGCRAAEVFDGRRKPTPAERLRALIANVPLGPHLHLLERGPGHEIVHERVTVIEEEADRLAYELLAPAEVVAVRAREVAGSGNHQARLAALLQDGFGLPAAPADAYSRLLLPPGPVHPLLQRLGRKP